MNQIRLPVVQRRDEDLPVRSSTVQKHTDVLFKAVHCRGDQPRFRRFIIIVTVDSGFEVQNWMLHGDAGGSDTDTET